MAVSPEVEARLHVFRHSLSPDLSVSGHSVLQKIKVASDIDRNCWIDASAPIESLKLVTYAVNLCI